MQIDRGASVADVRTSLAPAAGGLGALAGREQERREEERDEEPGRESGRAPLLKKNYHPSDLEFNFFTSLRLLGARSPPSAQGMTSA